LEEFLPFFQNIFGRTVCHPHLLPLGARPKERLATDQGDQIGEFSPFGDILLWRIKNTFLVAKILGYVFTQKH
jgi:hypothetical protein